MPPEAATSEAPAAPAEAPAPSPNGPLSEDDQIIEDLRAEGFAQRDEPEEPAPEKPAKGPKVVKGKPAPATPGKLTVPTYATPQAALDAVTAALEAGDMDALSKATGKPKSMFALSDSKWTAFRAEKAQVKAARAEVERGREALTAGRKAAQEEYGPAITAARAYRDGDLEKFVTLVSELTGEDYAVSQKKVIEGVLAADPNVKALRKQNSDLAKRLADLERAPKEPPKPAEPTPQDRQAAYTRVLASMESELSGQPITKVAGYQNLVLTKVRDSFDPAQNAYTLDFAEAAEQVLEDRREEAAALGFVPRAAAPKPRLLPPPAVIPSRSRAADARVPDGEPWLTQDLDDDDIIASLERDRKAGRLR